MNVFIFQTENDEHYLHTNKDMFIFTTKPLAIKARLARMDYDCVSRIFTPDDLSVENCMRIAKLSTNSSVMLLKKRRERRVLSFCLWGTNPMYSTGLLENIKLSQLYYPDWEIWIYLHTPSVPETIQNILKQYKVKIIPKAGPIRRNRFMLWRIEPLDDNSVDRLISRDSDSRISPKEVLAVREWVKTNKTLHIMRDHPHHYPRILGGMFGIVNNVVYPVKTWREDVEEFYSTDETIDDQQFLYERFYNQSRIIHDDIKKYEGEETKDFILPFEQDYTFIGCRNDETNRPNKEEGSLLLNWLRNCRPDRISMYMTTYHDALQYIRGRVECCYVMHYSKLVERKKLLSENIERNLFDVIGVEWIENFDREDITPEMIKEGYKYDSHILPRPMTKPEIANGLAHIHIIEKAIHNNKITLVLEDDTVFKNNFIHNLSHVLHHLPSEWDLICLGGPTSPNIQPAKTLPNATDMEFDTEDIVLFRPSSPGMCTMSCFLINSSSARKIIDAGLKPLSAPIDDSIWALGKRLGLRIYWVQPWISFEGSKDNTFSTTLERGF